MPITKSKVTFRANAMLARRLWGQQSHTSLNCLKSLTNEFAFSVQSGDLRIVENKWYITHTGLLRLAKRRRCHSISTAAQRSLSDPATNRWVFRAIVYRNPHCKGFVGYADADPSNVSPSMRGAELRIAETRAVNRALRKAYGVGVCSYEELGGTLGGSSNQAIPHHAPSPSCSNRNGTGQPRLRDQLWMVVRQFQLDPTLVKNYATDYCGVESLTAATRESIEAFVSHLKKSAEEDHAALICKLNSYTGAEVQS